MPVFEVDEETREISEITDAPREIIRGITIWLSIKLFRKIG